MLRAAALALLLALTLTPSALADGDPASDILIPPDVRVYMTNGAKSSDLEKKLAATAQQVSDAGLPIKVAVIGNKTDLGAVPQLWGKPQTYAKFLGAELRFVYKDTLLVVMPQGFGINGPFPRVGPSPRCTASTRARTRRLKGSRAPQTRRCARSPRRTAALSAAAAAAAVAAASRCRSWPQA